MYCWIEVLIFRIELLAVNYYSFCSCIKKIFYLGFLDPLTSGVGTAYKFRIT